MRAALVKQVLDVFGAWATVKWKDTSPKKLFEVWPGKAAYWELTCMLEADWYVVEQSVSGHYVHDAILKYPGREDVVRKYTKNIVEVEEIPFEQYDLVITLDAILEISPGLRTTFAYFANESWDPLYKGSVRQPVQGYDVFLAHMLDSRDELVSLPQAISFPYPYSAALARSSFPAQKEDAVWVDWRTLVTLAMGDETEPWSEQADAAAGRLQAVLGMRIEHRGSYHKQVYAFSDPPTWGDSASYLQAIAGCRYYFGVGKVGGPGQSLPEAAALGCLCIGQADKPYHRLVCHPSCLCEGLLDMPRRWRALVGSRDLQAEVLEWQDQALRERFQEKPLRQLHKACEWKRRGLRSEAREKDVAENVSVWPRIALVTPVWNSAKYVEQTIESVLGQEYPNLEYWIVDGGSTDGTLEVIRRYEDRLTGWISEPDNGMYDALNKGFARTTGEVMGWISATDKLHPGGLKAVGEVFRKFPQVEWITGRPTHFNEDGLTINVDGAPRWTRLGFLAGFNRYIQQESTYWRRSLWSCMQFSGSTGS